ncbi:MAG: radical SAM protein [Nitrospinales bacterium]
MTLTERTCKSILSRTSGYLKTVCSHSLNPYVGCGFGLSSCGEACYVRFNPWLTQGREWGRFVDVKINAPEVYSRTVDRERNWTRIRREPFAIFFSSSTDPWQPVERKYRISRQLLRAMRENPPDELILQTHTSNILDDAGVIVELSHVCRVRVHISIEGDRERLPGLPAPPCLLEERIQALRRFADAGVMTVACLSPLYPLMDPHAFFSRLAKTGIAGVVVDHFIRGDGTEDGSRTRKTRLPDSMAEVNTESLHLAYRDEVVRIARNHLPVGVSRSGFAGNFSR